MSHHNRRSRLPQAPSTYALFFARYGVMLICVWGIVRDGHAQKIVQVGYASYYGKAHHGKVTASGERYNMWQYTTAHATLPFDTVIRVTRLDCSPPRSVVVRVNDRGPEHHARLVDLSFMAACRLNMYKQGVAKVHIEVIRKRPRKGKHGSN